MHLVHGVGHDGRSINVKRTGVSPDEKVRFAYHGSHYERRFGSVPVGSRPLGNYFRFADPHPFVFVRLIKRRQIRHGHAKGNATTRVSGHEREVPILGASVLLRFRPADGEAFAFVRPPIPVAIDASTIVDVAEIACIVFVAVGCLIRVTRLGGAGPAQSDVRVASRHGWTGLGGTRRFAGTVKRIASLPLGAIVVRDAFLARARQRITKLILRAMSVHGALPAHRMHGIAIFGGALIIAQALLLARMVEGIAARCVGTIRGVQAFPAGFRFRIAPFLPAI